MAETLARYSLPGRSPSKATSPACSRLQPSSPGERGSNQGGTGKGDSQKKGGQKKCTLKKFPRKGGTQKIVYSGGKHPEKEVFRKKGLWRTNYFAHLNDLSLPLSRLSGHLPLRLELDHRAAARHHPLQLVPLQLLTHLASGRCDGDLGSL